MLSRMDPADQDVRYNAKGLMRNAFAKHRKNVPLHAIASRSKAIIDRLLALEEMQTARTVALFWPMLKRREVDLRALDETLRSRGVEVAYPAIHPERRSMEFFRVDDPDEMTVAPMGYREPRDRMTPVASIDVVVVPGLAFDARGYRIGYGGGYYDGALPRYCPPAAAIGVAFDFQLAAEIPNTDGDVALPRIVTDSRILAAS